MQVNRRIRRALWADKVKLTYYVEQAAHRFSRRFTATRKYVAKRVYYRFIYRWLRLQPRGGPLVADWFGLVGRHRRANNRLWIEVEAGTQRRFETKRDHEFWASARLNG